MAELFVVRRYAQALFEAAGRAGQVDQVEEELRQIDQILRSSPQLMRAFQAPTIGGPRKVQLVRDIFSGRASELTVRFLCLAVRRRREGVLPRAYQEFHRLANEARGVIPVQVTAAVPLTGDEERSLAAALGRRTGKSVELRLAVDPEILGGLVVRMGDTVMDGSVRTRLRLLRQRLFAGGGV